MEDMKIKCQDCGDTFTFTVNEQKFYEEKELMPPKRCRHCRQARKMAKEANNY